MTQQFNGTITPEDGFADSPFWEWEQSIDGITRRVTITADFDVCLQQEHDDGPLRPTCIRPTRDFMDAANYAFGLAEGLKLLHGTVAICLAG